MGRERNSFLFLLPLVFFDGKEFEMQNQNPEREPAAAQKISKTPRPPPRPPSRPPILFGDSSSDY
ncbi:hypothetical protein C1H46_023961 [Malus baccata]|uniref:Uncharacterized protein n=1 Tax=Malus baccata TaxID=106549 RepID=A0A540LVI9_MALBA|nr:hypothetical protein C1H46_023961 [Malus baccata]